MSIPEVVGFVTGALCVWLLARQNIWNWPIGIANNLAFFVLFLRSGLYADAGLQIAYFLLAVYGLWTWTRGGARKEALPVTRTSAAAWYTLAPATLLITLALTAILRAYTDSNVPVWDALTTALSLAATYGQCKKLLESWWLWIAADCIYIPLYGYKSLWLTSFLYLVFLILCILGLRAWQRSLTGRETIQAAA